MARTPKHFSDPVRDKLPALLKKAGLSESVASKKIGHNGTYLNQFLKDGVPKELKERDRHKLAAVLGVDESELRSSVEPVAITADNRPPPVAAAVGAVATEPDPHVFHLIDRIVDDLRVLKQLLRRKS